MDPDIQGILVVDKEKGMTSHDVVDAVRRRFGVKKVGHAGTLDPNATGVLVILLGKATKLSATLTADDKEYEAVMKLGERTASGDRDGEVIARGKISCSNDKIKNVIHGFEGTIEQTPPMVSAKKVGGQRLYRLARKGIRVERKPQTVTIKQIAVTDMRLPEVVFRVVCSKGTYIRQLADDIGEKLGCGAYLEELRRLRSGRFSLEKAVPFSLLENMTGEELGESILRI